MADIRRILIIFVIGVLFSIFVFSFIEAVYPSPDYEDYCKRDKFFIEKPETQRNCTYIEPPEELSGDCEGDVRPVYEQGCITDYKCETCHKEYRDARKKQRFWVFIISSIFGIVAVAAGIYLPVEKNSLHEWIGTGFMLGGLISLFIGTAIYFGDMERVLRPIIILIELIIIIYIAYKKLNTKK